DGDRAAGAGGEHHQAHDRGAADAHPVLLDLDRGVEAADELDELGRGAGVQAALVDDRQLLADGGRGARVAGVFRSAHLPLRAWLATLMYLRPAVCASDREAAM